jgi:hypothetical protein
LDSHWQIAFEDRYIREPMFGGTFGTFSTESFHFFKQDHPTYLRIAAIVRIRNRHDQIGLALRRGRQYLRQTSFLDRPFSIPGRGEFIGWSRILHQQEVLEALNISGTEQRSDHVTVDARLNPPERTMSCLYRGDWNDSELRNPPLHQPLTVQRSADGWATVRIDLPAPDGDGNPGVEAVGMGLKSTWFTQSTISSTIMSYRI